jgi:hypothetical protein
VSWRVLGAVVDAQWATALRHPSHGSEGTRHFSVEEAEAYLHAAALVLHLMPNPGAELRWYLDARGGSPE